MSEKRKKGRAVGIFFAVLGVIFGLLVVVLLVALGVDLSFQRTIRAEPIAAVDFGAVPDGTYRGRYKVGWRTTEAAVTIESGKVTDIGSVVPADKGRDDVAEQLFDRVIEAQSLQVDTISSATITSRSFLKSIENALAGASGA